jgi:hypothetical protein
VGRRIRLLRSKLKPRGLPLPVYEPGRAKNKSGRACPATITLRVPASVPVVVDIITVARNCAVSEQDGKIVRVYRVTQEKRPDHMEDFLHSAQIGRVLAPTQPVPPRVRPVLSISATRPQDWSRRAVEDECRAMPGSVVALHFTGLYPSFKVFRNSMMSASSCAVIAGASPRSRSKGGSLTSTLA